MRRWRYVLSWYLHCMYLSARAHHERQGTRLHQLCKVHHQYRIDFNIRISIHKHLDVKSFNSRSTQRSKQHTSVARRGINTNNELLQVRVLGKSWDLEKFDNGTRTEGKLVPPPTSPKFRLSSHQHSRLISLFHGLTTDCSTFNNHTTNHNHTSCPSQSSHPRPSGTNHPAATSTMTPTT